MGDIVMGRLGRGLDALLSHRTNNQTTRSNNQSNMKELESTEPEHLSAMELVYALYAEEAANLVGSPSAGFAYFLEGADTLVVVSDDPRKVRHVSMESIMATDAMKVAQELGASFMPMGNLIICNINGISQTGSSYSEAAMRAILANGRLEKSSQE